MRRTVTEFQEEPPQFSHVRVLEKLENWFSDPLYGVFQEPMLDEDFNKFQDLAERNKSKLLSIQAVCHWGHAALSARYGHQQNVPLPFEDEVIAYGQGNGKLRLRFLSNRIFRGDWRVLGDIEASRSVFDAATGHIITAPESITGDDELDKWLNEHGKGDLFFDDAKGGAIVACRDAKIAVLDVSDWTEADKINDETLRGHIRRNAQPVIPLKKYREMHRNDPDFVHHGQPFIAVETREKRLAIIRIKDFSKDDISVYTRTRPTDAEAEAEKR